MTASARFGFVLATRHPSLMIVKAMGIRFALLDSRLSLVTRHLSLTTGRTGVRAMARSCGLVTPNSFMEKFTKPS
jgi:hypothetical protein